MSTRLTHPWTRSPNRKCGRFARAFRRRSIAVTRVSHFRREHSHQVDGIIGGVGVSIWLHDSGVVVLQKDGNTIVTDISMLEHVSLVLAGAHARIGRVTRIGPDRGDE